MAQALSITQQIYRYHIKALRMQFNWISLESLNSSDEGRNLNFCKGTENLIFLQFQIFCFILFYYQKKYFKKLTMSNGKHFFHLKIKCVFQDFEKLEQPGKMT